MYFYHDRIQRNAYDHLHPVLLSDFPADICPVDARLEEEAHRKGYELLRHSLDLYGRCKNCTRKKAGQEDPV